MAQYDLRLVCDQCSVKEQEITYKCKPVPHKCALSLLLCRDKGSSLWRPVSKPPTFPNPSQYQVCWFFREGQGCSEHRHRCSFARSSEEAAVWNFEKKHKLDHLVLSNIVAQQHGTDKSSFEQAIDLMALDLKTVCEQCCTKEKEITYIIQTAVHKCSRNILLAKGKASDKWRPVAARPSKGSFGQKVQYQACNFFTEGSGCTKHGEGCTYARSSEEATVWNFVRNKQILVKDLIRQIAEAAVKTPEQAAQEMVQQFPGHFSELCSTCFYERPSKLTVKKWNDCCSAEAAHKWQPLLVHHPTEQGKMLSQIRPLPQKSPLKFCSHVRDGKPCWHNPGHCMSAQSEVEMHVWRLEQEGLMVRPLLLQFQPRQDSKQISMYCKVCFLTLSSAESFYKHCSSLEHTQLLREDTSVRWRERPPPHSRRADFWICDRPKTCEYGSSCPKAHSKEELQEWIMRTEEVEDIRQNIEAQGLMSYNERLLQDYRSSSNEVHIISEHIDDVSISCDEDFTLNCELVHKKLQWNFQVETERALVHVALLKQEPGACFSLGDSTTDPCIYLAGHVLFIDDTTYQITVSFTSEVPGFYEQWLVLDFDRRPVLLRKLRVAVGQPLSDESEDSAVNRPASNQKVERWHSGNRVIVHCLTRTEEQEEMKKQYKSPQVNFLYKSTLNIQTELNQDNYKEQMHHFLYSEELAEDQVVSRLNVCGQMQITDHYTLWGTEGPQLFGMISLPFSLTPDSHEGLVLRRSIQCALIAPTSSGPNSNVYEAIILLDKTTENIMYLQLSKRCCFDLRLRSNTTREMEVQFQHNRYQFCSWHKVVDLLPDTHRVLPDLKNCTVPVNNVHCEKLNAKQRVAVEYITGNTVDRKRVAPLLIYGPFGTGKTFTLATAAIEVCQQPSNKVLICTHTNSSADLYVRDHFHEVQKIKPLRIKANTERGYFATDEITLKYCLLNEDEKKFLSPTKAVLDQHNVIILTTTMARQLHDLKLPEGYFSHILIDEASQMLECEALSALGLAGPGTKVALAGDHMQMGPKLFSVGDHRRSDHTLLTRLFHYYQLHQCDAAQSSRIILSENYRSTKEIVDFVSTHFYTGKGDIIKSSDKVPPPANGHALRFSQVRGKCLLHSRCLSWYNSQEAYRVVEAVKDVLQNWPSAWGPEEPQSICVQSEGFQVQKIRTELSKKDLSKVQVHNLANVQGLQFRVVIISAVQSRESLDTRQAAGLELFNDVRVLNTALTRAQSLVIVVGDAAALCSFGQCSQIWKNYVDYCIQNSSIDPQYFTKDFFEKDLIETKRFQKSEQVEENDNVNDKILQELKAEHEEFNKEQITEDDDDVGDKNLHQKQKASYSRADSNHSQLPEDRHGKLVRETYNHGYVIPSSRPHVQIPINGRGNLGKAFTGDEVIFEKGKVVAITKESEQARVFVCILEDEDHSQIRNVSGDYIRRTMVPITKSAPKICIHINKKKRRFLPVWAQTSGAWAITHFRKLDEKFKQDHVFLVQVLAWKDKCRTPLGNVIDVFPIGNSLSEGLLILNQQYNVPPMTYTSLSLEDEHKSLRKNRCKRITFTVDPLEAKDLDDAISVEIHSQHYELGIHIADVASYVSVGDELDEIAKQRCVTYYCRKKSEHTIHMFPQELSTGLFSLLPDEERSVVSLMLKVENETNEIMGKPVFELSTIKSDCKLSYGDAEEILNKVSENPLDRSVKLVYEFSKACRKKRLQNWPYAQPDDDRLPGDRKANFMIEELSVLFNQYVSEILTDALLTRTFVPLRCQPRPSEENMDDLKKLSADLLPVSFSLWHKFDNEETAPTCDSFRVLYDIWKNIREAAEAGDNDRVVDLVAADDIHPQLMPITNQFRKCLNKAYFIRAMSSAKAEVGHYSLNLKLYTQASSPIRRYIDLVLQRLLHCYVLETEVPFTLMEISALCSDFDQHVQYAKEHERKTETISCAVGVKKQSVCKVAFVVKADPDSESFFLTFPFNKDTFAQTISFMYKNLQLDDQPEFDETNGCVTLQWKRRIYAADKEKLFSELRTKFHRGPCLDIPFKDWMSVVQAIKEENWDEAKSLILSTKAGHVPSTTTVKTSNSAGEIEHEIEISLKLHPGDPLRVQMTCEAYRGYLSPVIQLVSLTPRFELCVNHVHNPVACFSRCADNPSQIHYNNTEDYVRIWKPLCEMESAAAAVRDNDIIIIENLEVNFSLRDGDKLTGNFFLHSSWIEDWAVECNLSKCLLCIRKPHLPLKKDLLKKYDLSDYTKPGDPSEFTWVAHGVTTNLEDKKKPFSGTGHLVHFYVNHLPMENIPDCIFNKTSFTVELIPKTLPDIRKESAVINVPIACELVKSIALGHHIPREVSSRHIVKRREYPNKLPCLNPSQFKAVDIALNNTFTLIQGPPGTGKTVVGVYIVLCFWEMNQESPRKLNANSKDKDKKQVILYCGPSNKSVDVVAEYMLKFDGSLKALRVYSEQVEMLDYPYPECVHQFSSKIKAEPAKQSLGNITLHHRIRQKTNPHSAEIKAFDTRIKTAINDKNLAIAAEAKEYRKLLRKAKKYELERHDLILCTCTQSSSPGLHSTVSARQILIDECAMATEPQALVPLVCNNPEKIVLIGDHKQLRPVVINDRVKKLGMAKSLFERYYTLLEKRTVMLDTQYRMHEDICEFPSAEYYERKLKTGVDQPSSVLRVEQRTMPVVFGDIRGVTIRQVVNTLKGNENSKANLEEAQKVVEIVKELTEKANIEQKSIVILSPYNAQVFEIKEALKREKLKKVHVNTITKSQGSEWRYVIISTVCSLPSEEIPLEPDGAWFSKHVGFVGDPNQINVAITRAKEGLCIIGNQELLSRCRSWAHLLDHYKRHNAVTDAAKICVHQQ